MDTRRKIEIECWSYINGYEDGYGNMPEKERVIKYLQEHNEGVDLSIILEIVNDIYPESDSD